MISTNAPLTMRAAKLASIELLKAEAERDLSVVQHAVETHSPPDRRRQDGPPFLLPSVRVSR